MANSSNLPATSDIGTRTTADDVRMSSLKHHFGLESLPQPVKDEIKRVLLHNFGPQFSVEDFFKSFELTLDGMQDSLNKKARELSRRDQELRDKDQSISRQTTRIYQLEQAIATIGQDLAAALNEKQALLIEKSCTDLCLRVYERLVLSLRKTIDLGKKRIEELNAKIKKVGNNSAQLKALKDEKDDTINNLTKKIIFLAREALKGKCMSFLRVLPDLRLLLGRLHFEMQAISGLLAASEISDSTSVLANNGLSISLESTHTANISSAATRAMRLTDSVALFLDEDEYLSVRVGGDVADDTSVAHEISKYSKGHIPPIESLMCRARSMVAEIVRRDSENPSNVPQHSSPSHSQAPSDSSSPSTLSTIFGSDSDHESSQSRPTYRRMVFPVNHVRIATAKMVHFGVGDSERSANWRSRA
ncbi:hypothetical protein PQX77_019782 [Marasmius sp. AFHP31]|nr:hypothetical protein PQX77_019782 [Marasmius sp. AFHP31]